MRDLVPVDAIQHLWEVEFGDYDGGQLECTRWSEPEVSERARRTVRTPQNIIVQNYEMKRAQYHRTLKRVFNPHVRDESISIFSQT
jgi:hypothetical protein